MWDMAMSGERLAFAREDGVWWTNVARHAGNLERIPCDGSSWRRVLWVGPRLFALGADEGGVTLAWSDMQGGDARRLHGSYVPDMAEVGGYIVLMQTSGLERYPTAQPTQPCQRVGMRAAWSPRRFAAALMDGDQWAALVVAQQAGNYRLVHVGFPGGECQLIGITMSTEPVVCAAGELLVVSSLEGAASRIWTFSTAQEE
jgi:hypothetical protein